MTSLKIAQILTEFIILLVAYLIVITPAGWFRSFMSSRMGDQTGKDMGLLTLNPFAHISIIGLICFLLPFYRFGWGRHVPVHLYAIDEKNRTIKFAVALFADTCAHWLVALFGLIVLGSLMSPHIESSTLLTATSPVMLSYARIVKISIHLSILLTVVSGIVNIITYYVSVHKPELYHDELFNWYFLFAYLIVIMTIGSEIVCGVLYGTHVLSQLICHILGLTPL